MKRTLLDLTQNILSSLNSDEVNSIGDTTESQQVAEIIRTVYYNILGRAELPEHEKLFQLTPSLTSAVPVLMLRPPEGVVKINWMKYFDTNPADSSTQLDQFGSFSHGLNLDLVSSTNWSTTSTTSNTIGLGQHTWTVASSSLPIVIGQQAAAAAGVNIMFGTVVSYIGTTLVLNITSTIGSGTFTGWTINNTSTAGPAGYKFVEILDFTTFLHMINTFNPTETNVQSYTFQDFANASELPDSFILYYKNDRTPRYCTVIQNLYFLFDSFDNTQDATLQASKTMVSGFITPSWSATDAFIPDLDDWAFPLLLNESLAKASFELKNVTNPHAEREIDRQWSALQKTKAVVNRPTYFDQFSNFGRRMNTGGYAIQRPNLGGSRSW